VVIILTIAVPVIALILFVVPVFVVPGGSVLCNINAAISFNIVRAATVDQDVYPWRCRQVAIDANIHIGNRQTGEAGKAWRCGKSGLGFSEAQGEGDCCHYQQGKNGFFTHYSSFFNW
jgi:hypothetical protein